MSKQRKSQTGKSKPNKEAPKVITYQEYFKKILVRGEIKPWQERELQTYFRDIGLTEKEPEDKYKIAFVKF